ncbi:Uncharacterised protein [uncultured archaeon]|nr:Uncharacterised protein [uncultured archaeon]
MDNKSIIFMTLIAAGLLLFGCLEFINGGKSIPGVIKVNQTGNETNQTTVNETNQTPVVTPKACEDMTVGMEGCIIQRAFNNNRYSDCQKLNGSWYTECVYKLAEISYSNCLRLASSDEADDCLINASSKAGDIACKSVINATKKDECILQTVSVDCRQIADDYNRYVCDAIASNNESICEKQADHTGHDNCYLDFSMRKRNVCNLIDNEGMRVACIGLLSNNSGQCAGITSATLIRDNCYSYYALKSGNCALCGSAVDSIYKDNCYVDCAVANNNSAACALSNDEQKADNCYWQYAVKAGNESACDPIKLKSMKRVCAEDVAKATGRPNACEIMIGTYGLTQGDVAFCYLNVIATVNVTFENCRLMNDAYYEDTCINNAIQRDNLSRDYCAYVVDDSLKASCFKS